MYGRSIQACLSDTGMAVDLVGRLVEYLTQPLVGMSVALKVEMLVESSVGLLVEKMVDD